MQRDDSRKQQRRKRGLRRRWRVRERKREQRRCSRPRRRRWRRRRRSGRGARGRARLRGAMLACLRPVAQRRRFAGRGRAQLACSCPVASQVRIRAPPARVMHRKLHLASPLQALRETCCCLNKRCSSSARAPYATHPERAYGVKGDVLLTKSHELAPNQHGGRAQVLLARAVAVRVLLRRSGRERGACECPSSKQASTRSRRLAKRRLRHLRVRLRELWRRGSGAERRGRAVAKAGAVEPWQMCGATARQCGLAAARTWRSSIRTDGGRPGSCSLAPAAR